MQIICLSACSFPAFLQNKQFNCKFMSNSIAMSLFDSFAPLSSEEWNQKLIKSLKGKELSSLNQQPDPEISLLPFYRKENTEPIVLPALDTNDWLIALSFSSQEPQLLDHILKALAQGMNSIRLKEGLPTDLDALARAIYPEMIEMFWDNPGQAAPLLSFLNKFPEWKKGQATISLSSEEREKYLKEFPSQYRFYLLEKKITKGELVHSLAKVLKEIHDFFEMGISQGMSAEGLQRKVSVGIELSDDYFLNIAYIRALKRTWLSLLEGYGIEQPVYLHIRAMGSPASSSDSAETLLIRNSIQALSAAIAAVHSIELSPAHYSKEKIAFGRRIALNLQHMYKMESHLDHFDDAASGSYFIENYTAALIGASWNHFCNAVDK
jgi:methylmalonyl-CoA mutase